MRLFGHAVPIGVRIGLAIVACNAIAALFAPIIAPFPQAEILGGVWEPPSVQHWLGLDSLGRDMFSRVIYGARMSIGLSVVITFMSFFIGIFAGFTAAIQGGKVDMLLSRLADLMLAMPTLIFALLILSVLGTSLPVLAVTIALLDAPKVYRISRSIAMNIAVLDYVESARLRGEGTLWLIRREILPNALPPLLADFGLRFCFTFLFIAALSFLGLGIQPPDADWGSMVKENAAALMLGSLAALYPALAISLLTIGVNLVVDWLLFLRVGAPSPENIHEQARF